MKIHPLFIFAGVLTLFPATLKAEAPGVLPADDPIFSVYEGLGNRTWYIQHTGPLGLGFTTSQGAKQLKVEWITENSPAGKSGKFKKGQMIDRINGYSDWGGTRDPRIVLGNMVTRAEATDGRFVIKIAGGETVNLQIPVLGSYSPTWPLNCPKSDKIVSGLAEAIIEEDKPRYGAILFLLSTGEEKHLAVVRRWVAAMDGLEGINADLAFQGIALCEYYLRTGDKKALQLIQQGADELSTKMYRGSWNARGNPARFSYGTMHGIGIHCATFMTMAKLCGAKVDDALYRTVLEQFYRYAGHGLVSYGDGPPEQGFRDNGKTPALAMLMEATRQLNGGQESTYSKARDVSAMKGWYGTNWFNNAHTGGGIGEIWRHNAINYVRESRPVQFRSFLDTRAWFLDLSRRADGSIGIAGSRYVRGQAYDTSATEGDRAWGTLMALAYTIPRNHLQLFGAPRSPHAVSDPKLTQRPWGNDVDEIFLSLEPVEGGGLTMRQVLEETVPEHSSIPMLAKLAQDETDATFKRMLYHPEFGYRYMAVRHLANKGMDEWILPLLRSKDARHRYCGLLALTPGFKHYGIDGQRMTPEMITETLRIVNDPAEAWWVTQQAMYAVASIEGRTKAGGAVVEQCLPRLIELAKSESFYMQEAAVEALSAVMTHPDYCRKVLPLVIETTLGQKRFHNAQSLLTRLNHAYRGLDPETQKFVAEQCRRSFVSLENVYEFPSGARITSGPVTHKALLGQTIKQSDDGIKFMLAQSKATVASERSGKASDMYHYKGFVSDPEVLNKRWINIYPNGNVDPGGDPEEQLRKIVGKAARESHKPSNISHYIRFKDDGAFEVGRGWNTSMYQGDYVWTKGYLVGTLIDQAREYRVIEVNGFKFLAVCQSVLDVSLDAKPQANDQGEAAETETPSHPGWILYSLEGHWHNHG